MFSVHFRDNKYKKHTNETIEIFSGGDDSTDGDGAKNEAREEAEGDLVVK